MNNDNTLIPNQEFKVPDAGANKDVSSTVVDSDNPNPSISISDPYDYILNTPKGNDVVEKQEISDNHANANVGPNLQGHVNTPPVPNTEEVFSRPHQVQPENTTFRVETQPVDPVVKAPEVEFKEQIISTSPEDIYSSGQSSQQSIPSSSQGNNVVFNSEVHGKSSSVVSNVTGSSTPLIEEVDSIKSENVIAASSYILVFDIATFILALIRKDKFLQFNSVQSIFFNLTFVIVFILFRIISVSFLSFFFTLLNIALFTVWLVISIFLMYKAYNGEKFCLSFFGRIANTLS